MCKVTYEINDPQSHFPLHGTYRNPLMHQIPWITYSTGEIWFSGRSLGGSSIKSGEAFNNRSTM